MQERYYHEATPDGGTRRTDRLRGVERTTEDGYMISAYIRQENRVYLRLLSNGGTASDVLDPAERVSLAKLLLSGLPLDQVRAALPAELFTTEWALRQNDSNGNGDIIHGPLPSPEPLRYAQGPLAQDGLHAHVVRREVTDWMEA